MADAVGNVATLRMLYVLTYCDTAAVGPGAWTEWKAALLSSLYQRTMLALEGKDPLLKMDERSHRRLVEDITGILADEATTAEIETFLDNMPPKYVVSVPPARMARHLRMLRLLKLDNRIIWEIDEREHLNYTEITAVSYDVPGFMCNVCGALSSKDVNILSVQVFSSKDGYAIDTFQVTDLRGQKLPHGFRLERLRGELNRVLLGKARAQDIFHVRRRARLVNADRISMKPTEVILDNEGSSSFTMLEVRTFDRPALLYRITSKCAEQGYYIHLAMITTEAYHVVDVFYITDLEFNKLEPPQMKKLKEALEEVLSR